MDKKLKILITDKEGQTLASYAFKDREKAYAYAEELEAMGIEIELKEPSLPETLILSLGANDQDTDRLKREIEEEIEDHDGACCAPPPTDTLQ